MKPLSRAAEMQFLGDRHKAVKLPDIHLMNDKRSFSIEKYLVMDVPGARVVHSMP